MNNVDRFAGTANCLSRSLLPVAFCVLLASLGCGGHGGAERFEVSGAVTYDGQPVPVGSIVFLPDTTKGNSGPAGSAYIEDGRYDTREGGKGIVGGPHLVQIMGYDGVAVGEEIPACSPLFPRYETAVDFPKEDTIRDFDCSGPKPSATSRIEPEGGKGRVRLFATVYDR